MSKTPNISQMKFKKDCYLGKPNEHKTLHADSGVLIMHKFLFMISQSVKSYMIKYGNMNTKLFEYKDATNMYCYRSERPYC